MRPARRVAVGLLLAALGAGGCGPETRRADITLSLTAVPGRAGGGVVLLATGSACGGSLEVDVDRDGDRFEFSGRGRLPDNEDGYCDRYIDTGGSGPTRRTVEHEVDLAPGTYVLRDEASGEEVRIRFDGGVVASDGGDGGVDLEQATARLVEQRNRLDSFVDDLAGVRQVREDGCEQSPEDDLQWVCDVLVEGDPSDPEPLLRDLAEAAGCGGAQLDESGYVLLCRVGDLTVRLDPRQEAPLVVRVRISVT